jgi:FAD synthase
VKLLKHTRDFARYGSTSVVTIGVFDGVHRGHQAIIAECVKEARRRRVPSVALTFERNPREVVCGESPCVITSPGAKIDVLASLGIDFTISVSFGRSFASMLPEEFCRKILVEHLGAGQVCVGENFHFGRNGAGDVGFPPPTSAWSATSASPRMGCMPASPSWQIPGTPAPST